MRNTKELLELLLENKHLFKTGLCSWTINLLTNQIISVEEREHLDRYIKKNRPCLFSSWSAFKERLDNSCYYWGIGIIKYRVDWVKKHIKLNT